VWLWSPELLLRLTELQSTQNHMLRRIAGHRRRPEETWVEWVKRSTRAARKAAVSAGIRFWLPTYLRSKWCWAGHVMRMHSDRLARRALVWRDSEWQAAETKDFPGNIRIRRPRRTRWFRWEDELRRFAVLCGNKPWQEMAKDRDSWLKHADNFIKFAMK